MAARIKLTTTAGSTSPSITYRLADPPFLFVFDNPSSASVGGSVDIEMSMETAPLPNLGGGVSNSGTTDANVDDWITIIPTINAGDSVEWKNPLYRVRVNAASATGSNPINVYVLEGIRSLKNHKTPRRSGKQYQSRNGY